MGLKIRPNYKYRDRRGLIVMVKSPLVEDDPRGYKWRVQPLNHTGTYFWTEDGRFGGTSAQKDHIQDAVEEIGPVSTLDLFPPNAPVRDWL